MTLKTVIQYKDFDCNFCSVFFFCFSDSCCLEIVLAGKSQISFEYNALCSALGYMDTSRTGLKVSLITKSLGLLTTKESNTSANWCCLY